MTDHWDGFRVKYQLDIDEEYHFLQWLDDRDIPETVGMPWATLEGWYARWQEERGKAQVEPPTP